MTILSQPAGNPSSDTRAKWQYEAPVTTLRGEDHSGAFCAALATFAGSTNAHNAAYQKAVENGDLTYSYRYEIHKAVEYQGGYCAGYLRWGSTTGAMKYRGPADSMDQEYEGSSSSFEMGLEIGWYYEPLPSLYFSPVIRLGGGKWKWDDVDGRELSSNVADMGVGGDLDWAPSWLYGIGLHLGLFYNAFGDGIGIRGGFDYTLPVMSNLALSIGMMSDLRHQGYSADNFDAKSDVAGPMLRATYYW